jgi:hypothetical protein
VRDYPPLRHDRREALAELRTGYGVALPGRCRREVERELSCLELVLQHITEVEEAMAEPTVADGPAAEPAAGLSEQSRDAAAVLEKLTCVGRETAVSWGGVTVLGCQGT